MPSAGPDLIGVRPDEAFDVGRVAEWLSNRLPRAVGRPQVSQFSGGHANLTYLLTYEEDELVLRRPPIGPVAPSSHDMSREFHVLSRLWRSFEPAPRALQLCNDLEVIGAPFLIMERRPGVVVRGTVPAEFGAGSDPRANRLLAEVVIDTLATLHDVDPAECDLADLGHPDGFLERQVQGWHRRWEGAADQSSPIEEAVSSWLFTHLPTSPTPALIHNDWRLDNLAVDPADPGRCIAVYDWDMCTRGDPLADLGTLLAVWYEPDEVPATLNPMPVDAPGFLNRGEASERYARARGADLSQLDWYLVFGSWKMAVVLKQIHARWLRGQTRDDRFAEMGLGAARMLELAAGRIPTHRS
jgi:aminoglycoside phosphotransferase (APT) family kinase protein